MKLKTFLFVFVFFTLLAFKTEGKTGSILIGIARHDSNMYDYLKPGTVLPERKQFFGRTISVRTFFTTIFEPWNNTRDLIGEIKSLKQTPFITLEFRSWAQIVGDELKIKEEKQSVDGKFGAGYYDRIIACIKKDAVLEGVVQGEFDKLLGAYAKSISPVGNVNIRLFHEPFWFPWKIRSQKEADLFINAVKHVYKIFEKNRANNVKWVITFDISGMDVETAILKKLLPLEIVSVVELDGYNDAWRRSLWKKDPDIEEMFGHKTRLIKNAMAALPAKQKKPKFIIGETAFDGSGSISKKQMYLDLADFVKANDLDGVVFLDEDDGPITEKSWHVNWTMSEAWVDEILDKLSEN